MNIVKPIRLSGFLSVACIVLFAAGAFGQGRYANVYSRSQVDGFIAQLEQSSDGFKTDFRREINDSNLSGSTKRQYNRDAEQFENAVDVLRRRFNSSNSWWESRNDVQNMISNSQNLNSTMNTAAFRRRLERQWNRLRNDINKLADTFDLPGLNGGGWSGGPGFPGGGGGPGWGGGQTSRPPGWAQGTFYSVNSRDNITLTIDSTGRVSVVNNGQTFYGTFYRNQLMLNGDLSDISRNGDGIRTYNRSNGQTTLYSRNGGGGGGGGGNISRPPSWAVGSFYATNGSNITLTIYNDGRVMVINGGQTYYGTFYNNTMTLNGDTSTISQTRRGITTYNQSSGQTTEYRRQ